MNFYNLCKLATFFIFSYLTANTDKTRTAPGPTAGKSFIPTDSNIQLQTLTSFKAITPLTNGAPQFFYTTTDSSHSSNIICLSATLFNGNSEFGPNGSGVVTNNYINTVNQVIALTDKIDVTKQRYIGVGQTSAISELRKIIRSDLLIALFYNLTILGNNGESASDLSNITDTADFYRTLSRKTVARALTNITALFTSKAGYIQNINSNNTIYITNILLSNTDLNSARITTLTEDTNIIPTLTGNSGLLNCSTEQLPLFGFAGYMSQDCFNAISAAEQATRTYFFSGGNIVETYETLVTALTTGPIAGLTSIDIVRLNTCANMMQDLIAITSVSPSEIFFKRILVNFSFMFMCDILDSINTLLCHITLLENFVASKNTNLSGGPLYNINEIKTALNTFATALNAHLVLLENVNAGLLDNLLLTENDFNTIDETIYSATLNTPPNQTALNSYVSNIATLQAATVTFISSSGFSDIIPLITTYATTVADNLFAHGTTDNTTVTSILANINSAITTLTSTISNKTAELTIFRAIFDALTSFDNTFSTSSADSIQTEVLANSKSVPYKSLLAANSNALTTSIANIVTNNTSKSYVFDTTSYSNILLFQDATLLGMIPYDSSSFFVFGTSNTYGYLTKVKLDNNNTLITDTSFNNGQEFLFASDVDVSLTVRCGTIDKNRCLVLGGEQKKNGSNSPQPFLLKISIDSGYPLLQASFGNTNPYFIGTTEDSISEIVTDSSNYIIARGSFLYQFTYTGKPAQLAPTQIEDMFPSLDERKNQNKTFLSYPFQTYQG